MTEPTPPSWERATLERLALRALDEQRRARQWSTLIRLLWLTLFFLIVAAALGWIGSADTEPLRIGKHTALVDLRGVIGVESRASADKMNAALAAAFKDKHTQGVVLRINSPGGSPVQSGYINDEIRRLRARYPDIPLHVVVQDLCASGGYYVAVAADRIYVDKASLVGSIGVIMGGFGFTGAMEKLGIDRRSYAAGENKDFLDPFAPENPAQREHVKRMLDEIHQQFIKVVKGGRGKRLKESPEIFSGLVWTGERAVELGLADGFGSLESVAREVIKAERVVDFTPDENYFEQLSKRLGASAAQSAVRALVEQAASGPVDLRWSR
ncbi:MAG TPA: S49 family peptidase [Usitatibacteraceae bacterium]|nr:S49 family peptidase [Usitatibacteraceae bacterium]